MDQEAVLRERVCRARAARTPLSIRGGGTKGFYGREVAGEILDVGGHRGVTAYEPTELVVAARAGTPLAELEALLAEQGQMLPFEPPHFGAGATLGGCVAAGLSGPRRPYAGAVRDFVLGVRCLGGTGEAMAFGGRVMKNVAGYDVSRLMAGALGTLGVLLEVALKVLPRPAHERTLRLEMDEARAITLANRLAGSAVPLSATCHWRGVLYLRLSGSEAGVDAAARRIGGDGLDGADFWRELREQRLTFFDGTRPLWRIALPPAAPAPALPGDRLTEWGGAQRWLRTDAPADRVRAEAEALGGHATLFRHGDRGGAVFHPLAPGLQTLHERLKQAFDPEGILNPGRLHPPPGRSSEDPSQPHNA